MLIFGLNSVKFFSNDFDTTTTGVDIVANYSNEMFGGDMNYALAWNYTHTTLDSVSANVNDVKQTRLEDGLPKYRASFTTTYQADTWRLMARANYYGTWKQSLNNDNLDKLIDADAEVLIDTEFSYDYSDAIGFAVGINNLLDENGPIVPGVPGNESGRTYASTSPFGFNGRFYYAKVSYHY